MLSCLSSPPYPLPAVSPAAFFSPRWREKDVHRPQNRSMGAFCTYNFCWLDKVSRRRTSRGGKPQSGAPHGDGELPESACSALV